MAKIKKAIRGCLSVPAKKSANSLNVYTPRCIKPAKTVEACLIFIIKIYRTAVSGFLGPCCRFEPSCSAYAMEAIKTYGCLKGGRLSVKRIMRCHPWHAGGLDPVP